MTLNIAQFAADPMEFFGSLIVQTESGKCQMRDVWAPFQRERFKLIAPAILAVEHRQKPDTPRLWLEATKGTSKTTDVAAAILHMLAFAPEPILIQIGAADADQASEIRMAAAEVMRCNKWLAGAIEIQNWVIVNERTGSRCEILAADSKGSHGARPSVVVLDELHAAGEEFCSNLLDNLDKMPTGLGIICTNAGILDTWQYSWRTIAQTSDRWRFNQIRENAPWIGPDALAEAKRRNPTSRYLRLWEGIWVSDAGDAAISDEDLTAAVAIGPMQWPSGGYTYGGGLDLAWRRDRAAFVVLGADHDRQRVKLASAQDWSAIGGRDIDLTAVMAAVVEARNTFGMSVVFGDECQAVLMSQILMKEGITFIGVPQSGKVASARGMTLVDAFKNHEVDLYDCPPLIRDLKKLRVVERSGSVKLDAPRDETGHADLGFAFSFVLPAALHTCRQPFISEVEQGVDYAW